MALTNDLKQSILLAAISGRLTEQLKTDTPVDTYLADLEYEKEQYGGKRKARRGVNLSDISEDEIPCEIPQTWRYVRLIDIVKSISAGGDKPKNFSKEKTEKNTIEVISNGETNKGIFGYTDKPVITETSLTISGRGTIGYSVIRTEPYVPIVRLLVVLPLSGTNLEYIKVVLTALIEFGSGTAVKQLTVPMISPKVIPLPPMEEQQRIVECVNMLMGKLDEFSVIEQQLITLKANFPADMRGAILQAAMQGKLTEQLVSDSSITVALEKANSEKELLLLKKGTKYPAITDEEIPYDLPDNWQWVRLRSIVYNREQKTPTDTFSYIDIGSIDNAHQQLNSTETIIEASAAPSRARKIVKFGDVIYATVRPYLHNLCIIDREFSHEPIASTGFAAMVCHSCILNRYLLHYLMSPTWDKYANATDNAKGVAYPAINDKKLYAGLIPLPPIEEQKRIVERLDTLLPLCDTLME